MELILIRHADAESGAGYADDALRPLTAGGRKVQEKVAMALHKIGVRPNRVVTSPRRRAQETAEITAQVLGCGEPEDLSVLDGGYGIDALVQGLGRFGADEVLLCVGHEPDLSAWGAGLLAGGPSVGIRFRKSAVLGLGFEGAPAPGGGTLLYFYRPKDFEALLYKA